MDPIPLSMIQAGRDLTEPRLSPDGAWVAFVARAGGPASIMVVPVGGGPEQPLTFGPEPAPGRGLGGACFVWVLRGGAAPSIVYVARDGELWLQAGTSLEPLTSHERAVRAPGVAEGAARHRLVAYAVDEAEIWLLDLDTGAHRRLDDGRHAFCFDPSISPDEQTVSWQAWSPPDMAWDGAVRVDCDLATGELRVHAVADAAMQQPRFTPHGAPVHVHDGSGWLNVVVAEAGGDGGGEPVMAEPVEHAGPTWGMGNRSFAFDDDGTRMAFTRNDSGHGALCVIDTGTGEVEQIGKGVHGHLTWVGNSLVALRSGAKTPPQIVRYDMTTGERTPLALSKPTSWASVELSEPELFSTRSRDGLVLHGRRFVAGQGRMLCWVHGGPTDQWQVEWRPRFTYWLSRGWDVLVVDPRGTTGHGREYQQALHGCWGRADVDDTADLIAHAHAEGWSTPATTVVMGGSSGGLTVLGVLADHGELVSGGVASYPVSDLRALTEVTHRFEAHYTDTLVAPNDGSAESERRFAELSPITRAASIDSPLLLFHGSDDPVVPQSQSDDLVAAIVEGGGSVDYVVYEGEGHGFRDPANVADEYERTEAFLDSLR